MHSSAAQPNSHEVGRMWLARSKALASCCLHQNKLKPESEMHLGVKAALISRIIHP